jgi:hypothetical protein
MKTAAPHARLALAAGLSLAACSGATGGQGTSGTGGAEGDTGSLKGPGSFTPNSVFVILYPDADGGVLTTGMGVILGSSSPPYSCADYLKGTFPAEGSIQGLLKIGITGTEVVTVAYPVNGTAFVQDCDDGVPFCSTLVLDGPTAPTSSTAVFLAGGVAGSVTLTGVGMKNAGMLSLVDGGRYAGNISATMETQDGGEWMLSGSFDTGTVCLGP